VESRAERIKSLRPSSRARRTLDSCSLLNEEEPLVAERVPSNASRTARASWLGRAQQDNRFRDYWLGGELFLIKHTRARARAHNDLINSIKSRAVSVHHNGAHPSARGGTIRRAI